MVAMVCGMPRRVLVEGSERTLALLTFFTVSDDFKGQGLGGRIWAECLRQAKARGYDGAIHFCVEGNISNHITVTAAQRAGYHVERIFSASYLVRGMSGVGRAPAGVPSIEAFLRAANLQPRVALHRLWTEAEVRWQYIKRAGAFCVTSEAAAIGGYAMPLIGLDGNRCAVIEDVLWHSADDKERDLLLNSCVSSLTGSADIVTVPVLNDLDTSVFKRAGFRRSMRVVHAYLTTWKEAAALQCKSIYLDLI